MDVRDKNTIIELYTRHPERSRGIASMFYVYMMASESGTLYIGVTNDLQRRSFEHRTSTVDGFTKKYNCKKLIYYEESKSIVSAIEREKQLKNWNRKKKEHLIMGFNPQWNDLYNSL